MSEGVVGRYSEAAPPRGWLWGLAAAVFMSRLAAILVLRTFAGDAGAYEHEEIARSLVAGDGFQFRFFSDLPHLSGHQAPAIPALLAAGYFLFGVGTASAVAFVQCVFAALGALGAIALGRVAYHWYGLRGLQLAMLGFLAYPAFAYMPTRVQAVNWAVAFLLLMLAGFISLAERRSDLRVAFGTGLAGALGALGEPILAAPFGLCWIALVWVRRDRVQLPLAVAVAFWMAVSPWLLRNAMVLGQVGFVKSSFGYVAWQGNHLGASGTDKRAVADSTARALAWRIGGADLETQLTLARQQAITVDADLTAADSAAIRSLSSERERMDWFRARLREDLAREPAAYLRVSLARARMLLWFDETNPRSFVAAYRIPWLLLAGLAIVGLYSWRGRGPAGRVMWWTALAGLLLVHVLIIMSARFRLPIEALLLLPAAASLRLRRPSPPPTFP